MAKTVELHSSHTKPKVTYRYGASNVLFPFGFGLSYASFKYSALTHAVSVGPCVALEISVTVTNLAKTAAPEIVQAYLQWEKGTVAPQLQLVAFEKILVAAQGEVTVKLTLLPRHFAVLVGASTTTSSFLDCPSGIPTKEGCNTTSTHPTPPRWEVQPMTMKLWVGGQQPALRGNEGARAPSNVLKSTFQVTGDRTPLVTCPGGTPS
jgi:hypothetical protein